MTCTPDAKEDPTNRAGVCLACSLKCHEDHELVELYTKRNFRCDCGNPKFRSHPCQFTPNKLHLNEENIYNQNFSGLYCICQRPYPDPDVTEEDEMIQCIICEDWLHSAHLDATVPDNDQYAEMVCKSCMQKNNFLHNYSKLIVNSSADLVDSTLICNEENINVMDTTSDMSINNIEKLHEGNIDPKPVLENKDISLKPLDTTKDDMEISMITDDKAKQYNTNKPKDIYGSVTNQELQVGISSIDNKTSCVETEQENFPNNSSLELNDKLNQELTKEDNEETKMACVSSLEISEEIIELKSRVTCDKDPNAPSNKSEISENCVLEESMESSISSIANSINCSVVQDSEVQITETSTNILSDNKHIFDKEMSPKKEILTETKYVTEPLSEGKKEANNKETTTEIKEQNQNPKVINDKNGTESSIDKLQLDETENPAPVKSAEELLNIEEDKVLEDCEEYKSFNDKDITRNVDDNIAKKNVAIITECNLGSSQEISDKCIPGDVEIKSTNLIDSSDKEISEEKNDGPVNNTVACINNIQAHFQNNLVEISSMTKDESTSNEKINIDYNTKPSTSENSIDGTEKPENKRKLSVEDQPNNLESKKLKLNLKPCVKPKEIKRKYKGATFWPAHFRQKLCTCNECLSMYKDLSVLFLIDPDDTVSAYENLGKEKTNGKPASEYEKGMAALSSLDRVQQINALTEYNKMRDKLLDFLKSFKDRKEVVKEEDIKAFFAGMKPTREPDGVYFCR